jgi:hypothetical protein
MISIKNQLIAILNQLSLNQVYCRQKKLIVPGKDLSYGKKYLVLIKKNYN